MADIRISQAHTLTHEKAKAAAQEIAQRLAEEYDVQSDWEGDALLFRRSGISGRLVLAERHALLELNVEGLFKAFVPMIEAKVGAKMKKVFAAKDAGNE